MKIIEKNILTVEKGIICQQVNCQGVMGSGLAKSIRKKWPIVYERYNDIVKVYQNDARFRILGEYQYVNVAPDLFVCNVFGQLNYGYDGKRYTDYGALKIAFREMTVVMNKDRQNYFPFNFGCDRGGADWSIVSKMIEYYFPNAIICRLPKSNNPNYGPFDEKPDYGPF
jgi:hypothetical protein